MSAHVNASKLLKALRTLAEATNQRFPTVNLGGCCVFAAAVAEELERKGISTEIVTTGSFSSMFGFTFEPARARPHLNNAKDAAEWSANGCEFSHLGVRFTLNGKPFVYDTTALNTNPHYLGDPAKFDGLQFLVGDSGFTLEEAKAFADDAKEWNNKFDRSQIPALKNLIHETLENV
jgi:hypothetical protein